MEIEASQITDELLEQIIQNKECKRITIRNLDDYPTYIFMQVISESRDDISINNQGFPYNKNDIYEFLDRNTFFKELSTVLPNFIIQWCKSNTAFKPKYVSLYQELLVYQRKHKY